MPRVSQSSPCRYFQIAGMTIQVESDLPITDTTFHPKFKLFEVCEPGQDTITIRHHFFLPHLSGRNMGEEIYRKAPWIICKRKDSWIYIGISGDKSGIIRRLWPRIWYRLCSLRWRSRQNEEPVERGCLPLAKEKHIHYIAVLNHEHTRVRIYHKRDRLFRKGNLHSLTLFPTDQVLLARVLAEREGCYIHAAGMELDGKGLLFVGHSGAGKSTIVMMLKDTAKVLCDDRMIVGKWADGFRIYGTWSHGDVSEISADSAPLRAILFLEQAHENRLIHIDHKKHAIRGLLACLIKPFVTADWWDKMLTLVDTMACEVPCYSLRFDKSGRILDLLRHL